MESFTPDISWRVPLTVSTLKSWVSNSFKAVEPLLPVKYEMEVQDRKQEGGPLSTATHPFTSH